MRLRPITICRYCRETKRITKNKLKGVNPRIYLTDPYCSRVCCEADVARKRKALAA